jgi:hypothetical protein
MNINDKYEPLFLLYCISVISCQLLININSAFLLSANLSVLHGESFILPSTLETTDACANPVILTSSWIRLEKPKCELQYTGDCVIAEL